MPRPFPVPLCSTKRNTLVLRRRQRKKGSNRTLAVSKSPPRHRRRPSSPPTGEHSCRSRLARFLLGASLVPGVVSTVVGYLVVVTVVMAPSWGLHRGGNVEKDDGSITNLQQGSPQIRRLPPIRGAFAVVAVGWARPCPELVST